MARQKVSSEEYIEVLSQLILSNIPEIKVETANKLVEDILSYVGRLDYRYLYESLTWEHSKCLDELKNRPK